MTVAEFYEITPAELSLRIEVYNRKQQQRYDEITTVAYMAAYYQRVKKMPNLKDLLGKKEKQSKEQSPDNLLQKLKQLNAQLGGDVY